MVENPGDLEKEWIRHDISRRKRVCTISSLGEILIMMGILTLLPPEATAIRMMVFFGLNRSDLQHLSQPLKELEIDSPEMPLFNMKN